MITTHALTILVGALAFAFVLIGAIEPGHSASAETGDAAVAVGTLKAAR